jgi:hypothetical protein
MQVSKILNRPEYKLIKYVVELAEMVSEVFIRCSKLNVPFSLEIITQHISKSINTEKSFYIKSSPKLYEENRIKIKEFQRKYSELLTDGYLRTCLKNAGKDFSKEAIEKRGNYTKRP